MCEWLWQDEAINAVVLVVLAVYFTREEFKELQDYVFERLEK